MNDRESLARYAEARRRFSDPLTRNAFMAGAVWASERPRPRVVTDEVELDALPTSTVVMDDSWNAWQRQRNGNGTPLWSASGDASLRTSRVVALYGPLTVVWSPPVESGETQGGASS